MPMDFKEWLELQGCVVEVTQEDDGSGYEVLQVTTPLGGIYTMNVDTASTETRVTDEPVTYTAQDRAYDVWAIEKDFGGT